MSKAKFNSARFPSCIPTATIIFFALLFASSCKSPAPAPEPEPEPEPSYQPIVTVEPERFDWGTSMEKEFPSPDFDRVKSSPMIFATIKPGKEMPCAYVQDEETTLIVSEGEGLWLVNGKELKVTEGKVLKASPKGKHSIRNTGQLPLAIKLFKRYVKPGLVTTKPE